PRSCDIQEGRIAPPRMSQETAFFRLRTANDRNTFERSGQMQVPVDAGRGATDQHLVPRREAKSAKHDDATPGDDSPAPVEMVAIAGSLRAASWARSLLRAAATQLRPNVELIIWDGLQGVPPFNEDEEGGPVPSAVADMRHAIARSDALLIATPEYNTSIPGV